MLWKDRKKWPLIIEMIEKLEKHGKRLFKEAGIKI